MRISAKVEKLLMWLAPPVALGAYLWVSWWFSRWDSGEAIIVLLLLVVIGLAGLAVEPLRIWQKKALHGLLYIPLMSVLLFLGACQHMSAGVGPNSDELTAAILDAPEITGPIRLSTRDLRSLGCRAFNEEPTEFLCRFQVRDSNGAWRTRSAIVAAEVNRWVLLSLD